MEITTANKLAFAYTVKTLGPATVTPTDYTPFFERLKKFSIEIEYKISETDKSGKLHYHGILYLSKGFYRKKLCMKGFHVKLDQIYNKQGWIKYIHKEYAYPPTTVQQMNDQYEDELIEICPDLSGDSDEDEYDHRRYTKRLFK